jgi:hypothetical protein
LTLKEEIRMGEVGYLYYISKEIIDQIYNSIVECSKPGKTGKRTITAGLCVNLLSLLKGHIDFSKEWRKDGSLTSEDRAHILLKEVFQKHQIPDIKEVSTHEEPKCVYSFCLPIVLSERFVSKGDSTLIEVSHRSEGLYFGGQTSPEKWVSDSLLNTLLYNSPQNGVNAFGVLTPLQIQKEGGVISVPVKYLIIGHPNLSGTQ